MNAHHSVTGFRHDFTTSNTARISRFGRSAVIMRSRDGSPLDLDAIRRNAPSVFAATAHGSRSQAYTYIPTSDVLAGLAREGFRPVEVRQGGSGDAEKRNFTKHLIRMRHDGAKALAVGDTVPEVILINSHDGTSSYQLMAGLFRLVCSNGLVVAEKGTEAGIRIPHRGDIVGQVIDAAYTVIDDSRARIDQVDHMRRLTLSRDETEVFAQAALALRYDAGETPEISTARIVQPRRADDIGSDLWRTFNRTQENLIRGGVAYQQRDERTRRTAVRHTRPVNSIDGDTKLNRGLYILATEMARLKAAA